MGSDCARHRIYVAMHWRWGWRGDGLTSVLMCATTLWWFSLVDVCEEGRGFRRPFRTNGGAMVRDFSETMVSGRIRAGSDETLTSFDFSSSFMSNWVCMSSELFDSCSLCVELDLSYYCCFKISWRNWILWRFEMVIWMCVFLLNFSLLIVLLELFAIMLNLKL